MALCSLRPAKAPRVRVSLPSETREAQEETGTRPQRSDHGAPGSIRGHSCPPSWQTPSGALAVHSGCVQSSQGLAFASGHRGVPQTCRDPGRPSGQEAAAPPDVMVGHRPLASTGLPATPFHPHPTLGPRSGGVFSEASSLLRLGFLLHSQLECQFLPSRAKLHGFLGSPHSPTVHGTLKSQI